MSFNELRTSTSDLPLPSFNGYNPLNLLRIDSKVVDDPFPLSAMYIRVSGIPVSWDIWPPWGHVGQWDAGEFDAGGR